MSQKDVYEKCPVYRREVVTLRHTKLQDAEELLKCYSDEKVVPLFNADNCVSNFYYTTLEQVTELITRWNDAYRRKLWVRWTIIQNELNQKIGTVEMFNKGALPYVGSYGILRIDLRSEHENSLIIRRILQIANRHFYQDFGVNSIFTKAVPAAKQRILTLAQMGYVPSAFELPDYYARNEGAESLR
jgi:RimJ/RimL family protein N-acetyltransferase